MKHQRIKELVEKLNVYRNAYYNQNIMMVDDEVYDNLFDELKELEEETGFVLSNSPTQTVGYIVQDKLNKVKHSHPMLSLNKTKDEKDVLDFAKDKELIVMCKMDGLTCSLHYNDNGDLVSAETRGNGEIGEDIFENAKQLSNIPLHIDNNGVPLTIDGEVIVDYDTFNKINEGLENKFSHPRNLASGSIRQLDTKITKERNLKFIAWKIVEGSQYNTMFERLQEMMYLGFDAVPSLACFGDINLTMIKRGIENLRDTAEINKYPIDGIVFTYDDVEYGESLGNTGHHPRHSLAFKFYDDVYETTLRNIEWQVSRTGMVNPIAVFDSVDLDGAITTRATLHNISILKELELGIGDTITVYRANQVIPKIKDNLTRSNTYKLPTTCPECGAPVEIRKDGVAEFMYCTNDNCKAKLLSKMLHFCSKPCLDIEGLSVATIEKFIDLGILKTFKDIYYIKYHVDVLYNIEGFGKRSIDKLLKSIENSRKVKLENFINALGIDNVGATLSKDLSSLANGDYETMFTLIRNKEITCLGDVVSKSIIAWESNRPAIEKDIEKELTFIKENTQETIYNSFICDKIFTVTGSFNTMKRSELEKLITERGGKLAGVVNKKTDYLLTNETAGTTKYNKAIELNIPIMSEQEFLDKLNGGN